MNYVERHFGDWARDTVHLSMLEDGAYNRLVDLYYVREAPLPAEVAACCRLARAVTKPERDAVKSVLAEFFELTPEGWRHKRCESEIERFRSKSGKASASARARWGAPKPQSGGNANAHPNADANASTDAMRTHSDGTSNAMPHAGAGGRAPTPQSPLPRNTSEPNGSGGKPPQEPPTDRDLVFANGVTLLTASHVSDKNARSFLAAQCKQHGESAVLAALNRCANERPIEPVSWLQATLKAEPAKGRKSDALMAGNIAAAQRYLEGAEHGN